MVELMSYYRDAELHGAALLLRLVKMMGDDPDAQIKLTRHVAEETHHAWLWTRRITEMGSAPVKIVAGYQARIGSRTLPRTLVDLLTLTIVVEARSLARYQEHAARPGVDAATREVLETVSADEKWHLAWMRNKLKELTANDPAARQRAVALTERYRQIEEEVYAELVARERAAFGEDMANPGGALAGGVPSRVRL
jgi:bacterioferritin (cytochrome b1)